MIRLTLKDLGTVREYVDTEDMEYTWAVGMAGEVIIYFKQVHKVISNAEIDGGILTVYAPGSWVKVDVLPE